MSSPPTHPLLQALGDTHGVRPSQWIEDATEVRLRDTLACVEWDADAGRFELTVPLPRLVDGDDDSQRRLYSALLAWQWRTAGGADRLGFGRVEPLDQTVGMASVALPAAADARALAARLLDAHDALQLGWIECCTEVLAERTDAAGALLRA